MAKINFKNYNKCSYTYKKWIEFFSYFNFKCLITLIFYISDFHNSKIVNNIFFFIFEGGLIFLSRDEYSYIYIYIYITAMIPQNLGHHWLSKWCSDNRKLLQYIYIYFKMNRSTREFVFREQVIIRGRQVWIIYWVWHQFDSLKILKFIPEIRTSSSCRTISTDIPGPFSPPFSIVHCFR